MADEEPSPLSRFWEATANARSWEYQLPAAARVVLPQGPRARALRCWPAPAEQEPSLAALAGMGMAAAVSAWCLFRELALRHPFSESTSDGDWK